VGLDPAFVMRQRPAEGRRLVEIAEQDAKTKREAELKLLITLFEGVLKVAGGLAQLIARKPTL
jgi:hypothetical protein